MLVTAELEEALKKGVKDYRAKRLINLNANRRSVIFIHNQNTQAKTLPYRYRLSGKENL